MTNRIQIRRGLAANRTSVTPAAGELLYTTDTKQVFVGDGTTAGGTALASGPALQATASGALSNGSTVIVNSDGTVSIVRLGTVYENATTSHVSAVYDSNAQKVVIAYTDQGNSSFGTAVVGTVSGTSISFGTPVVFESASTSFSAIAYDSTNQKVVIAYRDVGNSNFGTAIVGTVSGTTISFGTAVVFESAATTNIAIAYDVNAQKMVIAYTDSGNSSFGTAIVGTVSGTSISFGTAVVFESTTTGAGLLPRQMSAVYHPVAMKVVIAYVSDANISGLGTARVGTVSGTTISFGTAVTFNATVTDMISTAYDSNAQRVVIAYRTISGFGIARVGTVAGTTISFGTAVVFRSNSTNQISATYDANAQKIVIAYRDENNSAFGTAIVGTVSGTDISFGIADVFRSTASGFINAVYDANAQIIVVSYVDGITNFGTTNIGIVSGTTISFGTLNSQNFIGISDGAYNHGQTATIQVAGAVDDAQSGLVPTREYFVQPNGSLGLTAGTPSVRAGTAVSTSRIIVKG